MLGDALHLPEPPPRGAKRLTPLQIELIRLLARAVVEEHLAGQGSESDRIEMRGEAV